MLEVPRYALGALLGHRQRSLLSVLGVAIGIAAVVVLTSIGEGTRRHVLGQFGQFGTNLVAVNPGRTETFGIPGTLGGTTHKLTIADAEAVARLPQALRVVPVVMGQGRVEAGGLARSVNVLGVTSDMPALWKFEVALGRFLPPGDWQREVQVAVLGPRVAEELFGHESPLGQQVRVAGRRLRVLGVMAPKGQILGNDLDDMVYVPVATAASLFNREELHELQVEHAPEVESARLVRAIHDVLTPRHGGRVDYTVTTQAQMLEVFGDVMDVLTLAVGGIGAVSLLVGAVGILTMMWISVGERTHEIGLLKALGASSRQVQRVFLLEAVALAAVGGLAGVALGLGGVALGRVLVPELPLGTPPEYVGAALGVSALTGLLAGVLPARRAARLDPIQALRGE